MNNLLKVYFLQLFIIFYSQAVAGDEEFKMKFGKVDKQLLQMKTYALDTGAEAVVIGDIGRASFQYNKTESNFDILFERHVRIKILTKAGYDHANFTIPLYHKNSNKEIVYGIKGYTFNYENGQEEKQKLKKDMIFDEEASANWDHTKITFPNVKEGSVIDFTYKIRSDFTFNLWEWEFQKSIPVAWSSYTVEIPEYYNYLKFTQGFFPLYSVTNEVVPGNIMFGTDRVDYRINKDRYIAKDMPAIKYEKFISTPSDFINKIEFQLASLHFPRSPVEKVMSDWTEVQKSLMENEKFGRQINRSGFFKDELENITTSAENKGQKIRLIYEYVRNKMEWNQKMRYLCTSNIRKSYKEGTGNVADINLLLIAMLREAGIDANPVILSTRNHGRVHPVYPIISKYNYVVAKVKYDDNYLSLDATDPYLPFGLLPAHCINLQGREISDVGSNWVDIRENCPINKNILMANLELTPGAEMKGTVNITSNGYTALQYRKEIAHHGEDGFVKEFKDEHKNWEIESHKLVNVKDLNESLSSEYNVKINANAEKMGNLIMISPVLDESTFTNLFKQEERKLPIDFVAPFYDTYIINLKIPDGYEIDELPEKVAYGLPGNSGLFSYSVMKSEGKIMINSTLNIKKAYFMPEEYPFLKQFFNLLIAKQNEQIVLKKI